MRFATTCRRTSAWILSGLLILLVLPFPNASATGGLHAQDLRLWGRVLDADTEEPVAQAAVTLLGEDRVLAGPVLTGPSGEFRLEWGGPSEGIRIRVERLGYHSHTTDTLTLEHAEPQVEIRLERDAIRLDPLDVRGSGRERGRDGFQRRREGDRGFFLDPIHIALMEAPQATDILRRVPGFYEDFHRGVLPMTGCVVTFLDHMTLPLSVTGSRGSLGSNRLAFGEGLPLNEVVRARDVRGVEAYRTMADVPDEIRRGFRWPSVDPLCGVVIVWTTIGW
jgi:hypothetical protein